MADKTLEEPENALEVVHERGAVEINQDKLDAILAFAERTEKVGRALDSIRKFVLNRALPGDWVQHGENVNLTGPGSERVLSALGLATGVHATFSGWGYKKDTGVDKNGEWFTWWYWADVEIGGLKLGRIEGRAGSRDKFFGYENNAWKDLGDVKEADIRMAARRAVIKEAVKVALGLRAIPANSIAGLGLDVSKIKKVEYGGGKSSGPAPQKAGTPLGVKSVGQRNTKRDGSGKTVYVIEDEKGVKYETFSETTAKLAKQFQVEGKKVIFDWQPNGDYAPKLNSLAEANASQPDPEPES